MKEHDKIKSDDSWNQFLASGKVEDYLSYVAGCVKENRLEHVEMKWAGDDSHAGICRSNRNYIETDAYR